jgi:O-acetyl-ADP-ribose deacetylase (regulator of RNase III)
VLDVTPAGDSPVRYVVNFPTKRHWRDRSRLDDIEAGLDSLEVAVNAIGISSIASPALGCGLGGLAWREVEPLIVRAADRMDARVLIFAP